MVAEEATQVDDVPTTSAATQTDPIEHLSEGLEFTLIAEIQTIRVPP